MRGVFKQAGWVSLGLHGALFLVLAITVLFHSEPRVEPTPFVFSMVQAEEFSPGELSGEPPPKADYEFALPEIAHADLPALPDIPEPVEEEAPVELEPPSKPTPKEATPSVLPKAKPKEEAPKKVSYSEFVKKQGPPKEPKPTAKKSAKVDTAAVKKQLAQALKPAGSKNGIEGGTGKKPLAAGPIVDASALAAYKLALRKKLDAVWVQPRLEGVDGLATEVLFDIAPNGAISAVRLFKSSGDKAFDQSVLDAFVRLGNAGIPPLGVGRDCRYLLGEDKKH